MSILRDLQTKLDEYISLDKAMEYRREWDPSLYADLFKSVPADQRDRGAFRIYLPYDSDEYVPPPRAPYDLIQALAAEGYDVQDYAAGLARQKAGTRVMKIGSLLTKAISKLESAQKKAGNDAPAELDQHIAALRGLVNRFAHDPKRQMAKIAGKLVVISRHPYDVASMSTGRGWYSCMNLVDGINRHYVIRDVRAGTLVAYLIREDDKNIQAPISRLLIKPFVNENDPDDVLLATDSKQYGTTDADFGRIVDAWLKEVNGPDKTGMYCLNDELYNDGRRVAFGGGDVAGGTPEQQAEYCENYLRANDLEPPTFELDGQTIILERWTNLEQFCRDTGDTLMEYLLDLRETIDDAEAEPIAKDVIEEALRLMPADLLRRLCERYHVAYVGAHDGAFDMMVEHLARQEEVGTQMRAAALAGSPKEDLEDRIELYIERGWHFDMDQCWLEVPRNGDRYDWTASPTLRIDLRTLIQYVDNHREDPNAEHDSEYNDLWKLWRHGNVDWSVPEENLSDSEWRGKWSDEPLTDSDGDDLVYGSKKNPSSKALDLDDAEGLAKDYARMLRSTAGRIEDPAQIEMSLEGGRHNESTNPMRRLIDATRRQR